MGFKDKFKKKSKKIGGGIGDIGLGLGTTVEGLATGNFSKMKKGGGKTISGLDDVSDNTLLDMLGLGSEETPDTDDVEIDTTTLLENAKKKKKAKLAGQRSTLLTESNLLLNPRLNSNRSSTLLG